MNKNNDTFLSISCRQDASLPDHFHIKVGRTTEPNRRMPQWLKQCPSKEPTLLALWPEDPRNAFLRGRMQHGDAGPWCHRLESLIHIELKDLVAYTPYRDPAFPKTKASKMVPSQSTKKPCADCECLETFQLTLLFMLLIGPYGNRQQDA